MPKPKKIILIRHGQSEGNVDREHYSHTPDFAIDLTAKGREQSLISGLLLKELINDDNVYFYNSPFFRARRTLEYLAKGLNIEEYKSISKEDVRLREQDFGYFKSKQKQFELRCQKDNFSHFYYKVPDGESGADVYNRVFSFLNMLYEDWNKESFNHNNCIFVSHGLTIRIILMCLLDLTVEEFDAISNPRNCQIIILEYNPIEDKYSLTNPLMVKKSESRWVYTNE